MSEVQKRKKGQILNNNERQLILNLMHYLKEKNAERSISEVIREISKATGCSERTIYKIRKEASKGIVVRNSRTRTRKKDNKNSRHVKYDSYVKSSIRKKVHNYLMQNIAPTLNTLLCLVNNDPDLPNFKRSTLHTLLKEIGFSYEQKGKKSLLTERNDLVRYRQQYLTDIRRFRSENRWIVYTGETLISLLKQEVQKDMDCEIREDLLQQTLVGSDGSCDVLINNTLASADIVNGPTIINTLGSTDIVSGPTIMMDLESTVNTTILEPALGAISSAVHSISCSTDDIPIHTIIADSTYLLGEPSRTSREQEQQTDDVSDDQISQKNLSAREQRFSIMHAGCDNGLIQGTDQIVLYRKKTEEIDSYEHWFIEKLLPKIPPNSVIVIDNNAPYHKRREENIPDGTWKKHQIRNWLVSKNIKVAEVAQKKELLTIVQEVRGVYSTKHKIDEMARERGITIMSLPPYHYELNPLNMVWGQLKYYVRANMKSFKVRRIKQLVREGLYTVGHMNWMTYIHHVRQTEEMLWAVDNLQHSSHMESVQTTAAPTESYLIKHELVQHLH